MAYDEMANGAYYNELLIDEYCDGEYEFEKMRDAIEANRNIIWLGLKLTTKMRKFNANKNRSLKTAVFYLNPEPFL